jgi:hypothetical protein
VIESPIGRSCAKTAAHAHEVVILALLETYWAMDV